MVFIEHLQRVVENNILSREVAEKYLNVYLQEADWKAHLDTLYGLLLKRYGSDVEVTKGQMKQAISCTIMLPNIDRSTYIDKNVPENLLFKCVTYHQFNERDWFGLLKKEVEQDIQISHWRNQCLSLGIVDPIDYAPYTRQAYNWLFDAAQNSGDITDKNKSEVSERMRNLIWAYGGMNVCNLFSRYDEWVKKRVLNWRTGYFFEKGLFEYYTVDQIVKIKKAELEKTNHKLVKKIG